MSMPAALRSIVVATDLGSTSDAVVRSAAVVAARTGAELHFLHSLEFPIRRSDAAARQPDFMGLIADAEDRLAKQTERIVPAGVRLASRRVVIFIAHKAILDCAAEVSADLIVIGANREGGVGAHFLGTTADRVIRKADVPCLVVKDALEEPIRRIGVPLDFSDPSQGALELALAWAQQLAQPAHEAELAVMHVGWTPEAIDDPGREDRLIRPELSRQVERAQSRVAGSDRLDVGIDVLWAHAPAAALLAWAEDRDVDLLVMGTHGAGGIRRALIGSMASTVARAGTCPVLLVPPRLWSGSEHEPRLHRVLVGTDFGDASLDAARWSTGILAPMAEHLLLHVLEVPEPPSLLAGRFGPRDELLRTARTGAEQRIRDLTATLESRQRDGGAVRSDVREGRPADEIVRLAEESDADLIVMAGRPRHDGTPEAQTLLGTTAERVIRAAVRPVLVVRGMDHRPPRGLLVPVDGSPASLRALAWGGFLAERFDAPLTALNVEVPVIDARPAPGAGPSPKLEWMLEREDWLRERLRQAGVSSDRASVEVLMGSPASCILQARERTGADLIVMGSHGSSALRRVFIGSVAETVLREVPCAVLVVCE